MNQKQKIWLVIFASLFLVPEILWSPVGNFVYSLAMPLKNGGAQTLRPNFLLDGANANVYSTILGLQLAGILLVIIFLIYNRKVFKNKIVLWFGCLILVCFAAAVFYLFGFSITLRHIGF